MAGIVLIAVTGAAGLIGSAVVRELNRQGRRDLLLVDHLGSNHKWHNLRSLQFCHYMEKQEFLAQAERLLAGQKSQELKDLEMIIHLGANSSTTESNISHLIENNYRYSRQLALLATQLQIRMVYASSAATYGDGSTGFDDDIANLAQLRPLNGYGYSKHLFDLWLKGQDFQPAFAGLKYFNVFGPNEYHKGDMRSLVLKAFQQIDTTGKLKLFKSCRPDYGHGEQKRDFLYVEDAARMTVFLALENRSACGLFNAGSGRAASWLELANAIFEAMKKRPQIEFIEMPSALQEKYQYYTCAPMQRLRDAGYAQEVTPLQKAAQEYIASYLAPGFLSA